MKKVLLSIAAAAFALATGVQAGQIRNPIQIGMWTPVQVNARHVWNPVQIGMWAPVQTDAQVRAAIALQIKDSSNLICD
jgi:hypothetical protein